MLVIFDCDGILVESEGLAAEAFSQLLARYNISLPPDECEALFVGKTITQCMAFLHQNFPGLLPDNFRELLDALSDEIFATGLQPVQDVLPVVQALRQRGIPMAVASNGGWAKIHTNLQRTGLVEYFGAQLFSAEHMAQPKPAPDVYLAAAEAQGVPPQFCYVVEDSDVGAQAGLSAGMRVLLFRPPWRTHRTAVPSGVAVFDDMRHLLGLIFNREA